MKKEREHPFTRLQWVNDIVFCNKCKTTLTKTQEKTAYTKEELPTIIKNILADLNEDQEKLPTDQDVQEYIKKWVDNNL